MPKAPVSGAGLTDQPDGQSAARHQLAYLIKEGAERAGDSAQLLVRRLFGPVIELGPVMAWSRRVTCRMHDPFN